jgi:hypothetical protein
MSLPCDTFEALEVTIELLPQFSVLLHDTGLWITVPFRKMGFLCDVIHVNLPLAKDNMRNKAKNRTLSQGIPQGLVAIRTMQVLVEISSSRIRSARVPMILSNDRSVSSFIK